MSSFEKNVIRNTMVETYFNFDDRFESNVIFTKKKLTDIFFFGDIRLDYRND